MFIFFIAFFINFQILLWSFDYEKTFIKQLAKKITEDNIKKLSTMALKKLVKNAMGELNKIQIEAFAKTEINILGKDFIIELRPEQIVYLSEKQIECLNSVQISCLNQKQIQRLSPGQIRWFKKDQIGALKNHQIKCLDETQIQGLESPQLQEFTENQIQAFKNEQIIFFYGSQIQAMKNKFSANQRKYIIDYYNKEKNQDYFVETNQPIEHRKYLLENTDGGDDIGKELQILHFGPGDNKIAYFSAFFFGSTFLGKIKESPFLFDNSNKRLYIFQAMMAFASLGGLIYRINRTKKLNNWKKHYYKENC